jgi:hypothetical protein
LLNICSATKKEKKKGKKSKAEKRKAVDVLIVSFYNEDSPKYIFKFAKHFKNKKVSVLIAEQKKTNRGHLLNAGIKWFAEQVAEPRYIILHDLSILPDGDLFAEYFRHTAPMAFIPAEKIYSGNLDACCGIFGISFSDFKKINGFPNKLESGECKALNNRLLINKLGWKHIFRGFAVGSPAGQIRENRKVSDGVRNDLTTWKTDGLNQVDVGKPDVLAEGNIYRVGFRLPEQRFELSGGGPAILILVPYADFYPEQKRSAELKLLISHFAKLKAGEYIKILICEQKAPKKYFNKGQLLNLGLKWYCDYYSAPDYVIFNDLDMLPDKTLFSEYIRVAGQGDMTLLLPFDDDNKEVYGDASKANICGGVFGISFKDFVRVNGFPNKMWLWGGEDNIMASRIKRAKIWYNIVNKGKMKHTDTIRLRGDKDDYLRKNKLINKKGQELFQQDRNTWKENGYSNITYTTFAEKK